MPRRNAIPLRSRPAPIPDPTFLDQGSGGVATINAARGKIGGRPAKILAVQDQVPIAAIAAVAQAHHFSMRAGSARAGGSFLNFFRRMELESEGVDLPLQLGCQDLVDEAVARQPRLAGKQGRYDPHAKVALTGAGRVAMASVQVPNSLMTSRCAGWNASVSFAWIVAVTDMCVTSSAAYARIAAIMAQVQRSRHSRNAHQPRSCAGCGLRTY